MTPFIFAGSESRFRPSVVMPSCTAIGAWHLTQNVPSGVPVLLVSRWPRWFIARKIGSSDAYACMLPDQSSYWAGWQLLQASGSINCSRSSVIAPWPPPQAP